MKINKYQIAVLTWGITMFLGYWLTSILLGQNLQLLVAWVVVISIALGVQAWFMWTGKKLDSIVHWIWVAITLLGSVLTYLGMFGYIPAIVNVHVLWLGLTAVGMLLTAMVRQNTSYYVLAGLYFLPAIFFQIGGVANDLIVVGLIFLVLGVVDAALEYSPWRAGLADFEGERVL